MPLVHGLGTGRPDMSQNAVLMAPVPATRQVAQSPAYRCHIETRNNRLSCRSRVKIAARAAVPPMATCIASANGGRIDHVNLVAENAVTAAATQQATPTAGRMAAINVRMEIRDSRSS